jgi:hypothetical protein
VSKCKQVWFCFFVCYKDRVAGLFHLWPPLQNKPVPCTLHTSAISFLLAVSDVLFLSFTPWTCPGHVLLTDNRPERFRSEQLEPPRIWAHVVVKLAWNNVSSRSCQFCNSMFIPHRHDLSLLKRVTQICFVLSDKKHHHHYSHYFLRHLMITVNVAHPKKYNQFSDANSCSVRQQFPPLISLILLWDSHGSEGRVITHAVSGWLPTAEAQVRAGSCHVRLVADMMALGQVLSDYFGYPCQFSFSRLLHIHLHPNRDRLTK